MFLVLRQLCKELFCFLARRLPTREGLVLGAFVEVHEHGRVRSPELPHLAFEPPFVHAEVVTQLGAPWLGCVRVCAGELPENPHMAVSAWGEGGVGEATAGVGSGKGTYCAWA